MAVVGAGAGGLADLLGHPTPELLTLHSDSQTTIGKSYNFDALKDLNKALDLNRVEAVLRSFLNKPTITSRDILASYFALDLLGDHTLQAVIDMHNEIAQDIQNYGEAAWSGSGSSSNNWFFLGKICN